MLQPELFHGRCAPDSPNQVVGGSVSELSVAILYDKVKQLLKLVGDLENAIILCYIFAYFGNNHPN